MTHHPVTKVTKRVSLGRESAKACVDSNSRSIYHEGMLGTTDLTNPNDIETLRRSVAMLPASADARIFSREEALRVLDVLQALLKTTEFD